MNRIDNLIEDGVCWDSSFRQAQLSDFNQMFALRRPPISNPCRARCGRSSCESLSDYILLNSSVRQIRI